MPLLRFYGVGLPVVRVFARELTETLAKVVQCPQDWFHLEVRLCLGLGQTCEIMLK